MKNTRISFDGWQKLPTYEMTGKNKLKQPHSRHLIPPSSLDNRGVLPKVWCASPLAPISFLNNYTALYISIFP